MANEESSTEGTGEESISGGPAASPGGPPADEPTAAEPTIPTEGAAFAPPSGPPTYPPAGPPTDPQAGPGMYPPAGGGMYPPTGPGMYPPTAATGPPGGPPPAGSSNRTAIVAIVAGVVVVALVAALATVLLTRHSSSPASASASSNHSANGEIFLASANSAGPNPFTPSVANTSSVGAATTTTTSSPTTTQATVVTAVSGGTVGLYGGTLNNASCNPDQMITYLLNNPALGRAWAGVEGISYSSLPSYIHSLTSVILRADTRVTNHGYYNGAAFDEQSVLQAGTAVLVDSYGVPRAKCYCGNPLTPPAPIATPTYQGTPWPTFSPTQVVIVEATTVVLTQITVIDTTTAQLFNRPIGTTGGSDTPYTPPGATTTTTTPTSSTTTPTLPPPTSTPGTFPPTTAPPSPGGSSAASALFNSRLAQCGGLPFLVNIQEQQDGESSTDETANMRVSATGNPNVYAVDVDMNESDGSTETTFEWMVSVAASKIVPQESGATAASQSCSALN